VSRIEVDGILHLLDRAKDPDHIVGFGTHVRRFSVLEERTSKALEHAARWHERRKSANVRRTTGRGAPDTVGERANG
jgi:hypothetical protein